MITEEMIKELKDKLSLAESAASAAKQELNKALDGMARQNCPHAVGDVIDCQGWSHKGKKMVVDHIGRSRWLDGKWKVTGRVFKKDGSLGQLICEFEGK